MSINTSAYMGEFVIDNRTEGMTATIGAPNLTSADVGNKEFPYIVGALSGEQVFGYKLFTGVFNDASTDRIEFPITLEKKSDGTTSSGTIKIFTGDGNTNPSSVIFQMNVNGQVTSQTLNVDTFDAAFSADTELKRIVVIFSDDQNLNYTIPENSIVDKLIGIIISSLSE